MRCLACNDLLTDREVIRKSATTGDYIDLCNHCFATIEDVVKVVESPITAAGDFNDVM